MSPQSRQGGSIGHERKDADVISLTMIALFLLLIIVICFLCVTGLLRFFRDAQKTQESARVQVTDRSEEFPQPRLQVNPESDLRESRDLAAATLDSYGWVDRKAGVAHIPIERAIQLTIERGLPEVGGGQTRLQLMQARPETHSQPNESITSPAPKATP
jgi:hypothetical protein